MEQRQQKKFDFMLLAKLIAFFVHEVGEKLFWFYDAYVKQELEYTVERAGDGSKIIYIKQTSFSIKQERVHKVDEFRPITENPAEPFYICTVIFRIPPKESNAPVTAKMIVNVNRIKVQFDVWDIDISGFTYENETQMDFKDLLFFYHRGVAIGSLSGIFSPKAGNLQMWVINSLWGLREAHPKFSAVVSILLAFVEHYFKIEWSRLSSALGKAVADILAPNARRTPSVSVEITKDTKRCHEPMEILVDVAHKKQHVRVRFQFLCEKVKVDDDGITARWRIPKLQISFVKWVGFEEVESETVEDEKDIVIEAKFEHKYQHNMWENTVWRVLHESVAGVILDRILKYFKIDEE